MCYEFKKSVLLYVEVLELYGRLLITEKRTLRAMGIRDVTEISLSYMLCFRISS